MKHRITMLLVLILLVSGCGQSAPQVYQVTGTVTYQGKALPLGIVTFVPQRGSPSQPGVVDKDGRYRLKAVAGKHAVGVIAMPPRPGGRPDPNVEGGIDYTGVPEVESLVPKKYNRHDTSGIMVVVEAKDMNKIDIHLE